jgi:3-phenylpropionate/cinnamic acid dioxygenase small subunit
MSTLEHPPISAGLALQTSALHAEFTLWLNDEALLLDRHRYRDWLALMAGELRYTMPARVELTRDGGDGVSDRSFHLDENLASMTTRIRRITDATNFAENPRTRTRRFVTNIRLEPTATPAVIEGSSYLLLTRSRGLGSDLELLSCERRDRLVRDGSGCPRLARREVIVDQATLGLVHLGTPL